MHTVLTPRSPRSLPESILQHSFMMSSCNTSNPTGATLGPSKEPWHAVKGNTTWQLHVLTTEEKVQTPN